MIKVESKKLENMVELEKQLADLQSRVGAELKVGAHLCGVDPRDGQTGEPLQTPPE